MVTNGRPAKVSRRWVAWWLRWWWLWPVANLYGADTGHLCAHYDQSAWERTLTVGVVREHVACHVAPAWCPPLHAIASPSRC